MMVFMADLRWSPCALGITNRVGSERRHHQHFLSTHPGCVESHAQGYTQREQVQGSCPVPQQLGTPGMFPRWVWAAVYCTTSCASSGAVWKTWHGPPQTLLLEQPHQLPCPAQCAQPSGDSCCEPAVVQQRQEQNNKQQQPAASSQQPVTSNSGSSDMSNITSNNGQQPAASGKQQWPQRPEQHNKQQQPAVNS